MRISDWSSDVCSSDLDLGQVADELLDVLEIAVAEQRLRAQQQDVHVLQHLRRVFQHLLEGGISRWDLGPVASRRRLQRRGRGPAARKQPVEDGRAPWRARVEQYGENSGGR